MTETTLPSDYDALKTLCETLQSQLSHQQDFIQNLLEHIRLSRHQHFGARSEAFNSDQLSLLNGAAEPTILVDGDTQTLVDAPEDAAGLVVVAGHCKTRGRRKPLPPELPRINIVHTLEGEACQCDSAKAL